ncbi:MAG: hypothetical protein JO263_01805, partial [Candidatus Eremiobacteraeota bacterium]|nr:hypothetical protein [Candidatus Eremiobacteraeota bacterium]
MTTRAQPAKSWDAAWRHLFRHIDDAKELRRNPIAVTFLGTLGLLGEADDVCVQAIRSFVLRGLYEDELVHLSRARGERARRHRAIVEQHVLAHRPAATVASELNISRMQLYRERRVVCRRLATALAGVDRLTARIELGGNRANDAIARAKSLAESSANERAVALADGVARDCGDPKSSIEALCTAADILTLQLQFPQAQRRLTAARALIACHAAQLSANVPLYEARAALVAGRLAFAQGRSRQARLMSAPAVERLRSNPTMEVAEREIVLDELIAAAVHALKVGRFKQFREHFSAAHSVATTLPDLQPRQKAHLFLLAGLLFEEKSENETFDDARHMLAVALDVARRAGLVALELDAQLSAAGVLAYGAGDTAGALREARPAVRRALETGDRPLIGTVCPFVAVIHNARGEFGTAATLLDLGVRHGARDAFA